MIIELGNHACRPSLSPLDDRPKVTRVHIPEADSSGLGGYTHTPGQITVPDFKAHLVDAVLTRDRITSLPEHEILVSLLHPTDGAWLQHATAPPAWVNVTPHELTPAGVADDLQAFLGEYWGVTQEMPGNVSDLYHDRWGPPGQGGPALPPLTALYTDDGRAQDNISNGGGQVGAVGQATASGATSLTTASTFTTNQWTGYRVYATVDATHIVWGNVISNTNAASASVLTVDRWYTPATPGGAAGSTPSATATFVIADGGSVAAWFVGLATGANAPVHGDHTLATNGNAEITTGGGGLIRKIAPYAQTSGVASRSYTLTPVYTANGSDTLPATVTTIGVFTSMVSTFGGAGGPMKFETALNASATLSAVGDQLTCTETVTGS